MDIDNNVIIKKVSDIISVLHTNPTAFGKQTGIDPGNLRRKLSKQLNFTSNDIIKMANVLDLKPEWFVDERATAFYEINKDRTLRKARSLANVNSKPFYDLDFSSAMLEEATPSMYIDIPWCEDVDFWVRITNSSMKPKIENGDIIGLAEVHDWNVFIPMGEIYAITTTNGLKSVRIIDACADSDSFELRGAENGLVSQIIKKSAISKLYKVNGIVKIL